MGACQECPTGVLQPLPHGAVAGAFGDEGVMPGAPIALGLAHRRLEGPQGRPGVTACVQSLGLQQIAKRLEVHGRIGGAGLEPGLRTGQSLQQGGPLGGG